MPKLIQEKFMRLAVAEAEKNLRSLSGGPFGSCIVKGGKVLAVERNSVLVDDATCHAEMNAIRKASRKMRTFDLSGCVIYSTTEPCPMCFAAIHWSRIDTIVFGTAIRDAKRIGFNEMPVSNYTLKKIGRSRIKIYPNVLRRECLALFSRWDALDKKQLY
jgi:guanine deaminase